ncbi:uncharacterized protein FIBRA_04811 [Fibroporia radiculosa]|uniref:Uncharacterized protein n=1 Tax=Fibroporia radiculosa TaxID=599839 RepID=J4GPV0_9APHY|nr:uncharacterized protein FIBRA_04811 [Fibroporia radiculosa]CCM02705.1 predicted protein [Fibroporia radiculosa]
MPVTFRVAPHLAAQFGKDCGNSNKTPKDLLQAACAGQWGRCEEVFQSSVLEDEVATLYPRSNGFVYTVMQAYNTHHHLSLRPDDVWIAILSQFSFYMNSHTTLLRTLFPNRTKNALSLACEVGCPRNPVDFGSMARQTTEHLHKNVCDEGLTRWILPDFTTTTLVDTTVCSVMMMSMVNSCFVFDMLCACGIPSVTLEGEKADWQKLLDRIGRLESFGPEPRTWAGMLRPILGRFVEAFDGKPDIEFWNHVAHYNPTSYGADDLSGWISAFCVWSSKGAWQAGTTSVDGCQGLERRLVLDGVTYPQMSTMFIPEGYCEVDITLNTGGAMLDCLMVAGHMAMGVAAVTGHGYVRAPTGNMVSPAPQWFVLLKSKHIHVRRRSVWDDLFPPPLPPKSKEQSRSATETRAVRTQEKQRDPFAELASPFARNSPQSAGVPSYGVPQRRIAQ